MSTIISCPLCNQPNFDSIDSLRIYLLRVAHQPLNCPICNEVQLGLDKLTIHVLSHVIASPPPISKLENINFSADHNNILRSTSMPDKSNEHLVQHSNSSSLEASIQPCTFCGCSFRSLELRQMHLELVHEIRSPQPSTINPASHSSEENSTNHSFECDLCRRRFKMKGSLRLHRRMVHGIIADNTQETAIESSTSVEYKMKSERNVSSESETPVANEKPFECDVCSKCFTTKYFLRKHKRLHTGEMPYVCEICNRTFTFQQSYHRHLSYHSDERPHICSICGRAFKELSTLHNHERIHSGEKPFKCDICDKCFRQRVSYLVHRRIHTGVMPYECTRCLNKFRYKISFRTHKCSGAPTASTSAEVVDDSVALACPKALDEFVNESYNRMGIVDAADDIIFDSSNSIEHQSDASEAQIPPIDDFLETTQFDSIEELFNSVDTNFDRIILDND